MIERAAFITSRRTVLRLRFRPPFSLHATMAAQMIIRASGRVSAVAALKVEVAAAGATAGHYATHGAFRALAVACGAHGFVGGAAYLCYSRGVGFTKYLLSAATSKAPRHDRERFCTEVRSNY